jgi:hypothetical protein
MIEPINIAQKFDLFQEYWHPKIVGELNTGDVRDERTVESQWI